MNAIFANSAQYRSIWRFLHASYCRASEKISAGIYLQDYQKTIYSLKAYDLVDHDISMVTERGSTFNLEADQLSFIKTLQQKYHNLEERIFISQSAFPP